MKDRLFEILFPLSAVVVICFLAFTFSSCEVKRMELESKRNQWMTTCVDRGGKIHKEVYSTNGSQYAYDTCVLEKK